VLVVAALIAVGCGGKAKEGPLPGIAEAKAERVTTGDGAATLTSTVTVRFDRTFTFAPRKVPLAALFEFAVPQGTATKRVLVKSARQSSDDSRVVILSVDTLIPDGAQLKVARKAFHRDEAGDITVNVTSDLDESLVLLASTVLVPTNPALFDTATVPPVTAADRDPAAMRKVLETHLRDRGSPDDVVARALNRYDTMPATVAGPKARAALAALTGTFAEPAIDSLLTGNNCTGKPLARLAFEPPPDNSQLFARVTYAPDGARIISLNPEIEGDRIEHIMPLLAHEPIHCDREDGRFEEIAATGFDTYLYLTLVSVFPDLASAQTKLARDLNIDAIAMVNSGRAYPELIGVLPSPGVKQVFPGTSSNAGSFAEVVAAAYPDITTNESPDEPLAQAYVGTLAQAANIPVSSAFNLGYLDQLLARSLDLQSYGAVLQAFGLQPG
jgi:hypothetical protein